MHVVLVARRLDRLAALADELGESATVFQADVSDLAQVISLFDEVRTRFGGLDLLFNNAGIGTNAAFQDSAPEQWKTMIDANLYGVLNCTHAAIALMRAAVWVR